MQKLQLKYTISTTLLSKISLDHTQCIEWRVQTTARTLRIVCNKY